MRQGSEIRESVSFENLFIVSERSEVVPSRVNLETKITKNVSLKIPFLSSSDDNITMADMAISMAKLGGIGVVNHKLSVEDQVAEIAKVKAVELTEEEKQKASIDANGKLLVAALVKLGADAYDRIVALSSAGLDIVIIESTALNVRELASLIEKTRVNAPDSQIIAGNAYSAEDVRILVEAGAEGIKIGNKKQITEQLGVDVLSASALIDIIGEAQVAQVPVIFDDNLTSTAIIAKAVAFGCSGIVIKDLLAKHKPEQIVNSIANNLKLSIAYSGNETLKTFIENVELSLIS